MQPARVLKSDGLPTASETERRQRWLDHFADVFAGAPLTMDELRAYPVAAPIDGPGPRVDPETARQAIAALPNDRGVGTGGVSADILIAGGAAMAVKLSDVFRRVTAAEKWPTQWAGSNICEVHNHEWAFATSIAASIWTAT